MPWIAVTDELPDAGEEVIVTTARGNVGGATFDGQHWFWESDVDGERPLVVTHWQDLPAPAEGWAEAGATRWDE